MAVLSDREKEALLKICSLSHKDQSTVKDVLFAILTWITLESYNKNDSEIILPYIAQLNFHYSETPDPNGYLSEVKINSIPMPALLKEFISIKNGEDPPTKKYLKRANRLHIQSLLKMDV